MHERPVNVASNGAATVTTTVQHHMDTYDIYVSQRRTNSCWRSPGIYVFWGRYSSLLVATEQVNVRKKPGAINSQALFTTNTHTWAYSHLRENYVPWWKSVVARRRRSKCVNTLNVVRKSKFVEVFDRTLDFVGKPS